MAKKLKVTLVTITIVAFAGVVYIASNEFTDLIRRLATTLSHRHLISYLESLAWPTVVLVAILLFHRPLLTLITQLVGRISSIDLTKLGVTINCAPEDMNKKDEVPFDVVEEPRDKEPLILRNLLIQAAGLMEQGNHREAIKLLKKLNQLYPNQWSILHNLAVELIKVGRDDSRPEFLAEAEAVCRNAIVSADRFPFGTYYNLARAQAAAGNKTGLAETLRYMSTMELPENLGRALAKEDPDIRYSDEIAELPEYKRLIQEMKRKYPD